jgi:fucose 4-O-acetylase-like acetyltransferase
MRYKFLDYTKGVLILLVTIGHAVQYAVCCGREPWDDGFFKAIYLFHMPLFMGISGFLAYSGIQKYGFRDLMLGKVKAYLIPIFAWAVIVRVGIYLVHRRHPVSRLVMDVFVEAGGSLWFLWALLGAIMITSAIRALGRHFWIAYAASFFGVLLLTERGNWPLFKYIYPYFQAGYLVAALGNVSLSRKRSAAVFAVAGALTVVFYLLWNRDTYVYVSQMALVPGNLGNIALRWAAGFSASLVAILTLKYLFPKTPSRLRLIVERLGQDSIYIYILQGYFFTAFSLVVSMWSSQIAGLSLGSWVAVPFGLLVASLCWVGGRVAAKSDTIAALFFGRWKKTRRALEVLPAVKASPQSA